MNSLLEIFPSANGHCLMLVQHNPETSMLNLSSQEPADPLSLKLHQESNSMLSPTQYLADNFEAVTQKLAGTSN